MACRWLQRAVIVAVKPLPDRAKADADACCDGVGGPALIADVERILRDVGFSEAHVDVKTDSAQHIGTRFQESGYDEFVRPASITAVK